jgi:hypothetical protein
LGIDSFGEQDDQSECRILQESLGGCQLAHSDIGNEEIRLVDPFWDGNFDSYWLGLEKTTTDKDPLAETHLSKWEWDDTVVNLENPLEDVQLPIETTPTLLSTSAKSTTSDIAMLPFVENNFCPLQSGGEHPSNDTPSTSDSSDTQSANGWLCDFAGCGKSFTHSHKLK